MSVAKGRGARHGLRVAAVVMTLLSLVSCGATGRTIGHEAANAGRVVAEGAGGAVHEGADSAARAGSRRLADLGVSAAEEARVRAAAGAAAERVVDAERRIASPHVAGLSADQARTMIKVSCAAMDIAEAGQADTWQDAGEKAAVSFGGRATLGVRIGQFAQDLHDAKTGSDAAEKMAVFALCESV
jgi:hypothetical protein